VTPASSRPTPGPPSNQATQSLDGRHREDHLDSTNPNVMSDEQMQGLRESMRSFGYLNLVILDQKLMVADGEHRPGSRNRASGRHAWDRDGARVTIRRSEKTTSTNAISFTTSSAFLTS
jgi:hypothetical protein